MSCRETKGCFYTMAKDHDHDIVRALETHLNIPWKSEIEFVWKK